MRSHARLVLHGKPPAPAPPLPFSLELASAPSWAYGIGAFVLTLVTAAFGLWRHGLPERIRRSGFRALGPPLGVLKGAHSGIVGEYLLWIVLGTTVIGGVWAITLR